MIYTDPSGHCPINYSATQNELNYGLANLGWLHSYTWSTYTYGADGGIKTFCTVDRYLVPQYSYGMPVYYNHMYRNVITNTITNVDSITLLDEVYNISQNNYELSIEIADDFVDVDIDELYEDLENLFEEIDQIYSKDDDGYNEDDVVLESQNGVVT